MSVDIKEIKIQYSDMTTTLSYDEKEKMWFRVVRGTKDAPCFACTTMDVEDMEAQLNAVIQGIKEQTGESEKEQ